MLSNRSGIHFCPHTNYIRLAGRKGPVLPPSTQAATTFQLAASLCSDFSYVVLFSHSVCLSFSYVPTERHCALCLFWFGPHAMLSLGMWLDPLFRLYFLRLHFVRLERTAVPQVKKHHYRTWAQESKANIPNGFLKTVLSVLSDVYCCQVRLPLCSTSAHLPLSVFGRSEMLGSWHSPAWVHQHPPAEIPAERLLS